MAKGGPTPQGPGVEGGSERGEPRLGGAPVEPSLRDALREQPTDFVDVGGAGAAPVDELGDVGSDYPADIPEAGIPQASGEASRTPYDVLYRRTHQERMDKIRAGVQEREYVLASRDTTRTRKFLRHAGRYIRNRFSRHNKKYPEYRGVGFAYAKAAGESTLARLQHRVRQAYEKGGRNWARRADSLLADIAGTQFVQELARDFGAREDLSNLTTNQLEQWFNRSRARDFSAVVCYGPEGTVVPLETLGPLVKQRVIEFQTALMPTDRDYHKIRDLEREQIRAETTIIVSDGGRTFTAIRGGKQGEAFALDDQGNIVSVDPFKTKVADREEGAVVDGQKKLGRQKEKGGRLLWKQVLKQDPNNPSRFIPVDQEVDGSLEISRVSFRPAEVKTTIEGRPMPSGQTEVAHIMTLGPQGLSETRLELPPYPANLSSLRLFAEAAASSIPISCTTVEYGGRSVNVVDFGDINLTTPEDLDRTDVRIHRIIAQAIEDGRFNSDAPVVIAGLGAETFTIDGRRKRELRVGNLSEAWQLEAPKSKEERSPDERLQVIMPQKLADAFPYLSSAVQADILRRAGILPEDYNFQKLRAEIAAEDSFEARRFMDDRPDEIIPFLKADRVGREVATKAAAALNRTEAVLGADDEAVVKLTKKEKDASVLALAALRGRVGFTVDDATTAMEDVNDLLGTIRERFDAESKGLNETQARRAAEDIVIDVLGLGSEAEDSLALKFAERIIDQFAAKPAIDVITDILKGGKLTDDKGKLETDEAYAERVQAGLEAAAPGTDVSELAKVLLTDKRVDQVKPGDALAELMDRLKDPAFDYEQAQELLKDLRLQDAATQEALKDYMGKVDRLAPPDDRSQARLFGEAVLKLDGLERDEAYALLTIEREKAARGEEGALDERHLGVLRSQVEVKYPKEPSLDQRFDYLFRGLSVNLTPEAADRLRGLLTSSVQGK